MSTDMEAKAAEEINDKSGVALGSSTGGVVVVNFSQIIGVLRNTPVPAGTEQQDVVAAGRTLAPWLS